MKIYVAGPMTGIAEHNYPAFHAATARLRGLGHVVINPAEINPDTQCLGAGATPEDLWRYCMRRDIPQLVTCSAVAVLPGWINSRGARLEVFIAIGLGMTILDYTSWKALSPWRLACQLAIRTLLSSPPDQDVVPNIETQKKAA